jgi:hypothetical protein
MTAADQAPETGEPTPTDLGESSLLAQQRMLAASTGYRAIALMGRVKRIAYIFQANVGQYKALVAKLQEPEFSFPIFDIRNPQAHDDLLSEAERLLHNVLMSVSTRIDQERAFVNKHFSDDTELVEEYRTRIEAFSTDVPSKFLKDLRNQITHHQLPVAQSHQTISSESISITFILPCAPLLEWDWSSGVREWLANQGNAVAIVDVVANYAHKAGDFDKWLLDRIGLKYATEIQKYRRDAEIYQRDFDRVFRV